MLVVFGSGPGIGSATAKAFAAQGTHETIVLVSRNKERLEQDSAAVSQAAQASSKKIQVHTLTADLADTAALKSTLSQIEQLGQLSCVLFNAARVVPTTLFEIEEDEILQDFKTTNIGLYTVARWAIPLLSRPGITRPSFLVTSGMLWKYPFPPVFSLCVVKTAQRNLVQIMQMSVKDVHIAMLHVAGQVSPEADTHSPDKCAKKWLEIYMQDKADWQLEVEY